jgi:Protein of unknown function (DUF3043)
VSLFSRKSSAATAAAVTATPETPAAPTAGKGAPTPKRRDKEPRRGPVPPPPQTQREAYKRAKASSIRPRSKEERRALANERRERMMRGDDTAVLPRDRGPVRRYVRDLVDARRNLAGLLMPVLLIAFAASLFNPLAQLLSLVVMLTVLLASILDSYVSGRQIARKVRERFPNGDPTGLKTRGFSIGYYAFNRAMLPRRMRAPRTRYRPGDEVP